MSARQTKCDRPIQIYAVDLFCGAGGLTKGLEAAGITVEWGADADPACEFPYATNNLAEFRLRKVEELKKKDFKEVFEHQDYSLLAGCAPCQAFSSYSQKTTGRNRDKWSLLREFARLVRTTSPTLVTMENVPRLQTERVFLDFARELEEQGYHVTPQVVNCADYGVPQDRNRLVLLASRLGPIELIKPRKGTRERATVRNALKDIEPLKTGEVSARDPMHVACGLSELNLKRIKASKPGGTWRDWDPSLVAKCHQRQSGATYPSVYGRMKWDEPSPTITTQFYGFGNGRFGHPNQHRALSLREGAILQSFPKSYKFVKPGEPVYKSVLGRLIGNAVPYKLGRAIGRSIVRHVEFHDKMDRRCNS